MKSGAIHSGDPAIVLLFIAIATVVFCGVFVWNPPAPRYYPVERAWRMPSNPAPGPAMGWYGRTGVALAASLGVAAPVAGILWRRDRTRRITLGAASVYAIAALLVACLFVSSVAIVYEQRAWFNKAPTVPKADHEY